MKGADILVGLIKLGSTHPSANAENVAGKAIARIAQLERAAGAAALAMGMDVINSGGLLDDAGPNTALRMIADAVGLDLADPGDLVRFQREYMARFAPDGSKNGRRN